MDVLQPLFEKLVKAKFNGRLELRFEAGEIASAELHHFLPASEFQKPLPTVEEEFTLES